jgi:hypothetical protein
MEMLHSQTSGFYLRAHWLAARELRFIVGILQLAFSVTGLLATSPVLFMNTFRKKTISNPVCDFPTKCHA